MGKNDLTKLSPEELVKKAEEALAGKSSAEQTAKEHKKRADAAEKELKALKKKQQDLEGKDLVAKKVVKSQMQRFGKELPEVIHNKKITLADGNTYGFLPGIRYIRIPNFPATKLIATDADGNKEELVLVDPIRGIDILLLVDYKPEVIQQLFDDQVNIFTLDGEPVYGPRGPQAVETIEVKKVEN